MEHMLFPMTESNAILFHVLDPMCIRIFGSRMMVQSKNPGKNEKRNASAKTRNAGEMTKCEQKNGD